MILKKKDLISLTGVYLGFAVLALFLEWITGSLAGAILLLAGLVTLSISLQIGIHRRTQRALADLQRTLSGIPVPPRTIPPHLLPRFSLSGKVGIELLYRDDAYSPGIPLVYAESQIGEFLEQIREKRLQYYGKTGIWLQEALEHHSIAGLEAVVLGSTAPRAESLCLHFGAKCTVIDYNRIISEHPGIEAMTVLEYEQNPRLFDVAISVSSFEHDGLGRYGDPVDPDGDLKAMRKARKMLRPGGLLFLAVPIGRDKVVWNAHRIYGKVRLPMLLEGWEKAGSFGFEEKFLDREMGKEASYQPVFVLRNPPD